MPSLFERAYRAAAKTELERATRELEDRNKRSQSKKDFEDSQMAVSSNVDFAERINIISEEQAASYRRRIKKAAEERERSEEPEWQEDVNGDGTSRGPRDGQFASMAEAKEQISRERSGLSTDPNHGPYQQPIYTQGKGEEDGARTH